MSEFERDILIARIADGGASEQDWTAFRAAAERDPAMWRELAELQRDAAALTAAVGRAIAVADTVEAPVADHAGYGFARRLRLAGYWGGWAAAAALVLMWSTGWRPSAGPGIPQTSTLTRSFGTPQEALDEYLTRGRQAGFVVGQAPDMVMLDARPATDGRGFEVFYIRQIMERTMVDDLYGMGVDDSGRPGSFRLRIVPAPAGATPGAGPS